MKEIEVYTVSMMKEITEKSYQEGRADMMREVLEWLRSNLKMPNYDFKCDTCGLSFEAKQDANDKQDLKCSDPNCDGYAKRQFPLESVLQKAKAASVAEKNCYIPNMEMSELQVRALLELETQKINAQFDFWNKATPLFVTTLIERYLDSLKQIKLDAVRLEILTARMRGCNATGGSHDLIEEAEDFSKDARAFLEKVGE